jgi:small-conductance mechanosensitive channel
MKTLTEQIYASIEAPFQQLAHFTPRIAAALIALLCFFLIGRFLGQGLVRLLERGNLTRTHKLFFRNLTLWFFILLGLGIGLSILGLETALAGFLAGSGAAAIILGFAFREIGENLLSGLFLAFSRPFNVGDFILSEGLEGEIREIELRFTHIRTADGRDIYIPNSQMFNKPLTNYTRDGLRRPAFTVGIDYADDPEAARELVLNSVRAIPQVLEEPEPIVVVVKLAPQYVELEVSFWINTFQFDPQGASSSRIAQEEGLWRIKSQVMETCRSTLLDEGFTVSANVTTSVALSATRELDVHLKNEG